ncbi:Ppx/GppA phosphatase family protein [Arenibaculum pallidiluteum]|uniref:Ppx/GppA phosphatase family protein n=1 Tax=Arenibaculum pallidiluteum TaxID=2812559 RepID=UPI002E28BA6D|nr:Ppx/GppA phosphatase family protein [Arenibaculum pallidiluteum]
MDYAASLAQDGAGRTAEAAAGAPAQAPDRTPDTTRRGVAGRAADSPVQSSRQAVPQPVVAALDLGTNNCRLLIARPARSGFHVIDAFSRIVRLGEGMTRSQALSDAAMDRAMSALRVCAVKLRRRGVTALRAVATEACRRAVNCADFVARVERDTGIAIEVISPAEEARLALAGCAPLLDPAVPRALVFDIGGGSTELMWLDVDAATGRPRLIDQVSIPKGVVTLAENFGGEIVTRDVYAAMVRDVAEAIAPFEARNGIRAAAEQRRLQLLGTSGTVTTLAGIHMGLRRYERALVDGSVLDVSEALAVIRRLLTLDFAGRAAQPCVGPDRADLVLAGCSVFEAMVEAWPVDRLRIADRGLREGILLDLIAAGDA